MHGRCESKFDNICIEFKSKDKDNNNDYYNQSHVETWKLQFTLMYIFANQVLWGLPPANWKGSFLHKAMWRNYLFCYG